MMRSNETVFDNAANFKPGAPGAFQGIEGLSRLIDQIPLVVEKPAFYGIRQASGTQNVATRTVPVPPDSPKGTKPTEVQEEFEVIHDPTYKAIVGERDGRLKSFVSPDFVVVQNREMGTYLLEAAKHIGLDLIGRYEETQTGKMSLKVVIKNPDYNFEPNTEAAEGDHIGMGIDLGNSYGRPSNSESLTGFGIRYECWNENFWGTQFYGGKKTHRGDPVGWLEENLLLIPTKIDFVREAIETAGQREITLDVAPFLRTLPTRRNAGRITVAQDVEDQLVKFASDRAAKTGNVARFDWDLINALTHAATHVASPSAALALQKQALVVLTDGSTALLESAIQAEADEDSEDDEE